MEVRAIGIIHTPFGQPAGTPIQPRAAGGAEGRVEVFPEYAEGLKDLNGFERVWLLYWFHQAGPVCLTVQPYMDQGRRGLFATRAPSRPNAIGLSCVRLLGIEGSALRVADVDILDGTPLLDIKPYVPEFDRFDVERIGWLEGKAVQGRTADNRFGRKDT